MNFFKFHFFNLSKKIPNITVMEFHKIQIYFMIKLFCVPFKQLRVFKEGAITILMASLIMKNGGFLMNFWNCPKENDKI